MTLAQFAPAIFQMVGKLKNALDFDYGTHHPKPLQVENNNTGQFKKTQTHLFSVQLTCLKHKSEDSREARRELVLTECIKSLFYPFYF